MTPVDTPEIARRQAFADEAIEYLRRTPPQLPSKYFYDALGSALFEAICHLPWYRITRAESALLERHAHEILTALPRPLTLAELGCGSGAKLATLAARAAERFQSIHLVDISPAALFSARRRIEALRAGPVLVHHGSYESGVRALAGTRRDGALMVLFLGSNLGNFDPVPARELLAAIRAALRPGDTLLLGCDLVKDERDLLRAYDDPLQVTAAFNRNLLRRVNDELGGTFALDCWRHRAVWNAGCSRVEMHLVAERAQTVRIAAAGAELAFERGDAIWTESSYKYEPEAIVSMGRAAGYTESRQWVDESARFALTRLGV
jgi:dimethylhistidine N-methyltransferase